MRATRNSEQFSLGVRCKVSHTVIVTFCLEEGSIFFTYFSLLAPSPLSSCLKSSAMSHLFFSKSLLTVSFLRSHSRSLPSPSSSLCYLASPKNTTRTQARWKIVFLCLSLCLCLFLFVFVYSKFLAQCISIILTVSRFDKQSSCC